MDFFKETSKILLIPNIWRAVCIYKIICGKHNILAYYSKPNISRKPVPEALKIFFCERAPEVAVAKWESNHASSLLKEISSYGFY